MQKAKCIQQSVACRMTNETSFHRGVQTKTIRPTSTQRCLVCMGACVRMRE